MTHNANYDYSNLVNVEETRWNSRSSLQVPKNGSSPSSHCLGIRSVVLLVKEDAEATIKLRAVLFFNLLLIPLRRTMDFFHPIARIVPGPL